MTKHADAINRIVAIAHDLYQNGFEVDANAILDACILASSEHINQGVDFPDGFTFRRNVADSVRAEMAKRAASIEWVATRAGVHSSSVYGLLNQSKIGTAQTLCAVARALGMNTDDLWRG